MMGLPLALKSWTDSPIRARRDGRPVLGGARRGVAALAAAELEDEGKAGIVAAPSSVGEKVAEAGAVDIDNDAAAAAGALDVDGPARPFVAVLAGEGGTALLFFAAFPFLAAAAALSSSCSLALFLFNSSHPSSSAPLPSVGCCLPTTPLTIHLTSAEYASINSCSGMPRADDGKRDKIVAI